MFHFIAFFIVDSIVNSTFILYVARYPQNSITAKTLKKRKKKKIFQR